MVESEQEKKSTVLALREEISQAKRQIKYLKTELTAIEGADGWEAQALLLKRRIENYEQVLEAAAHEILARTDGPVPPRASKPSKQPETLAPKPTKPSEPPENPSNPPKRGPGRPPKS